MSDSNNNNTETIINMAFGAPPGMSAEAYQYLHLALTACIGAIACALAFRNLRLSQLTLSFLWILYYVVGLVFHLCTWLSGDAQSYAFLGTTAIHVYIEALLCIKVLEHEPASVNWYASVFSVYFCVVVFVGLCLWQPLNVFFLGSFLALPVDVLVWPAAMALIRRTRDCSIKLLGWVWSLNAPIVCALFAMIVWGAEEDNNHSAILALALQVQYIALGICWVVAFRRRLKVEHVGMVALEEEQLQETGILPVSVGDISDPTEQGEQDGQELFEHEQTNNDKTTSRQQRIKSGGGGMMMAALFQTTLVVGVVFVVSIIVPLVLGRIDWELIVKNVCESYRPQNVQMLGNVGPNFVVPISCDYLDR